MKTPPTNASRGFTLIELLIASAISLIVLAAALDAGVNLQRVNVENQDLMALQTSLTFAERTLTQEIERAGAGMAQLAVMGYNQADSSRSGARLAITIEHLNSSGDAACSSGTCSMLTIYSGDMQNALQVSQVTPDGLIASAKNDIVNRWRDDAKNVFVADFLIVNPKAGIQCLIEDAAREQIVVSAGTSGTQGSVEIKNLTNLSSGASNCDLTLFKSGVSFVMPMRAASFLTNGFQINDAQHYIGEGVHTPRLRYRPNAYASTTWLTLSNELELLSIGYTIYDNADPTRDRHRITDEAGGSGDPVGLTKFMPTDYVTPSDMNALISDNGLLPVSDASTNAMVAMFNAVSQPEAYSIPLLRRISQIEIGLLARKPCREADRTKCTDENNDLDIQGRQVRTVTKRINPNNLSLIAINEAIRG